VGDELVAGAALLIAMALAGKTEGTFDLGPVDLGARGLVAVAAELLDYGKQISEQGLMARAKGCSGLGYACRWLLRNLVLTS
jgi:hypothetical protein